MIVPEEVVAESVAPTLRYLVAVELIRRGMRESDVAKAIGVSQAAVSKYRRGRVRVDPRVAGDKRVRSVAALVAEGIATKTMSPLQVLGEVIRLVRVLENRDLLCALHEEALPSLRGLGCDLCVRPRDSDLLEDAFVLSDLREALRRLEAEPLFAVVIPNVGSNLARARSNPKGVMDVAAVPGRIYEMKQGVRVPAPPEFGASKHVAEIVLAAAQKSDVRAGLCISSRENVLAGCRRMGWRLAEFDADYEGRGERLRAQFSKQGVPDVVFHKGAFGIEPIAYLLGPTATDVAERGIALARALSSPRRTSPSNAAGRRRGGAVSPRGS